MADPRDLPAVEVNAERPEKLSQSALAHADRCARASYLYLRKLGGTSHAMDRGSAYHLFKAEFLHMLIDSGKDDPSAPISAPPDVAAGVLDSVLGEHPELQIPREEQEALRIMAFHVATHTVVVPNSVIAVEKMLEMDVGPWTVRGKVDSAYLQMEGRHAKILDDKTGFDLPSPDQFSKLFQTPLYAGMLAFGKGQDDPIPIGQGIDTFEVAQYYPMFKQYTEVSATLTRQQLRDFIDTDLRYAIARIEYGLETGIWPAVAGSHCSRCPARHECPLPAEIIPVPSNGDVEVAGKRWMECDKGRGDEQAVLRAAVKDSPDGRIPLGPGLEFVATRTEREELKDKDGIKEFVIANGGDPSDYFKTTTSVRFGKKRVA